MSKVLLIDTDIIIDYLRNYQLAVTYLEKLKEPFILSVINVAELYAGIRSKNEKHVIDDFLHVFEIISLDSDIAKMGGQFRQQYSKSHGTGLADALIAATALQHKATLVTLNTKHYPMLPKCIQPYQKN